MALRASEGGFGKGDGEVVSLWRGFGVKGRVFVKVGTSLGKFWLV